MSQISTNLKPPSFACLQSSQHTSQPVSYLSIILLASRLFCWPFSCALRAITSSWSSSSYVRTVSPLSRSSQINATTPHLKRAISSRIPCTVGKKTRWASNKPECAVDIGQGQVPFPSCFPCSDLVCKLLLEKTRTNVE